MSKPIVQTPPHADQKSFTPMNEEAPIMLTGPSVYTQTKKDEGVWTQIQLRLSEGDRRALRCLYKDEGC